MQIDANVYPFVLLRKTNLQTIAKNVEKRIISKSGRNNLSIVRDPIFLKKSEITQDVARNIGAKGNWGIHEAIFLFFIQIFSQY